MSPAATDLYQAVFVAVHKALKAAAQNVAGQRDDFTMEESKAYELAHAATTAAHAAADEVLRWILE